MGLLSQLQAQVVEALKDLAGENKQDELKEQLERFDGLFKTVKAETNKSKEKTEKLAADLEEAKKFKDGVSELFGADADLTIEAIEEAIEEFKQKSGDEKVDVDEEVNKRFEAYKDKKDKELKKILEEKDLEISELSASVENLQITNQQLELDHIIQQNGYLSKLRSDLPQRIRQGAIEEFKANCRVVDGDLQFYDGEDLRTDITTGKPLTGERRAEEIMNDPGWSGYFEFDGEKGGGTDEKGGAEASDDKEKVKPPEGKVSTSDYLQQVFEQNSKE